MKTSGTDHGAICRDSFVFRNRIVWGFGRNAIGSKKGFPAHLLPGYYRDDPGFRDVPSPHANHLDYRDTGIEIATLLGIISFFNFFFALECKSIERERR